MPTDMLWQCGVFNGTFFSRHQKKSGSANNESVNDILRESSVGNTMALILLIYYMTVTDFSTMICNALVHRKRKGENNATMSSTFTFDTLSGL